MKYESYLFDFDGVIVDSMPYYLAAMIKILDDEGVKYGNDLVKIIAPLGYLGTAVYYKKEYGITMDEEEMVTLMKKYAYESYAHHIPAKANVIDTLKKLRESGAEVNILTASPHAVVDVCMQRLGITDFFGNVWSTDDFGRSKTDPKIYEEAAERIGRPIDEILFLDDNYFNVKTAAGAGMKVCGVYDRTSEDLAEEIKAASDHYVKDMKELLEI